MRNLHTTVFAMMLLAGTLLTSCSYTADDYVNDMKELSEKTIENADKYTAEDWQKIGEEFIEINKKGAGVLKDLSREQMKELKKFSKKIKKEVPDLDESDFDEMMDKAGDAMKDFMDKLSK